MSDAPFEKPGLNLLGDKEVAQGLIAESNRRLFQARTLAGIAGVPLFGNRREMPDGSVITTAVFGGQSRVNITGAPPPEKKPVEPEEDLPSGYLLWPTSDQNPDGVLIRDDVPVSPTVLLTMEGTSADVELDMPIQAARDDWLSDDGDGEYGKNLLTYQTDSKFRYQFAGYDNSGRGQPVVFVNGIAAYTQHGVRGACMRGDDTVIYASISGDWKTLTLRYFDAPSEAEYVDEVILGTYVAPQVMAWGVPIGTTFVEPVFFDGKGEKFVTVIRADSYDESGQRAVHRVRGAISYSGGELSLTVTTALISLETEASVTTDEGGWVYDYRSYGNSTGTLNRTYHYDSGYRDIFVGLDMSIDGNELLVTTRSKNVSASNDTGTSSTTLSFFVGGYHSTGREDTAKAGTSVYTHTLSINEEVIYTVNLNQSYSETAHTYSWVNHAGLDWTGYQEFRYEEHYDTPSVWGHGFGFFRDIDARFGAVVIYSVPIHQTGSHVRYGNTGQAEVNEYTNNDGDYVGVLFFKFGDEVREKEVARWPWTHPENSSMLGVGNVRPYRLFASRRKGELVANVSQITPKGPLDFPADMTPITVVRNKRADFTLSNEDLGLGNSDTGVTFYSVRMT